MILKLSWRHVLYCDICGLEVIPPFDTFDNAVEYKKKHQWKSQKHNNDWQDVCPECQCKG